MLDGFKARPGVLMLIRGDGKVRSEGVELVDGIGNESRIRVGFGELVALRLCMLVVESYAHGQVELQQRETLLVAVKRRFELKQTSRAASAEPSRTKQSVKRAYLGAG